MRKRPLVYLACVFLTGLVYQRYQIKLLSVVGLLLVVLEWYYGRATKSWFKTAGRSLVLLSAFLLGVFHMQSEMQFRDAYMSKVIDGSRITVWGELFKIESTDYGKRVLLSDCYIDFGEGIMPCNDIMVYTSKDLYEMGQIHKITGKINMFTEARNEGNFDSCIYYQSLKIDFAVEEETSVILRNSHGGWKSCLLSLREKLAETYEACLSSKAAGFYKAMVLGNKINLEESLKDLFWMGGISHILAISGLHVSILGRGLYRILRASGIGFGIAGICGGALLISYCVMVGSSTSTLRAVGMMLIYFLAQWIGRSYDMLNGLGAMVLVLLWENPFLIENTGFWFSVTALLGVGYVGLELSEWKKSKKCKKKPLLNMSGIWVSIGITLTTLPVTALSYYEVPIYSPMVNFLVLPLLTPVFCLAIIGGMIGCYLPLRGATWLLLQPCEWLLGFYELVCSWVSELPWASVVCGKPEWWQVVLYYILLFGGIYMLQKKSLSKNSKVKGKLWCAILCMCIVCIFWPKSHTFEITFLDVGQGDGIYISAGDGTTYFIDGGSSSVNEVGNNRILPFLKSKAVKKIDYWFVSHMDKDHVSGLYEILEKGYKIEHIVLSELCSSDETCNNLRYAARDAGAEIIYMEQGDCVCSAYITIRCLGPIVEHGKAIGSDKNENSLVLHVEYKRESEGRFTALFAGDISTEIEERLCASGLLEDIDLYKANHHGSNYSNSSILFEWITPEYIVVSCSKSNLYGHPGAKAVERMEACGAEIFYTMENGQIRFPLIQ